MKTIKNFSKSKNALTQKQLQQANGGFIIIDDIVGFVIVEDQIVL